MKMIFSSPIAVLAIWILALPSWAASPPYTLKITAEASTVKAGTDVYITIQITNTSKSDIDCTIAANNVLGVDVKYQYYVRDTAGGLISKRKTNHPEWSPGHIRLCTIKPGEVATSEGNRVSNLYDMSTPGQYMLRVTRALSDAPNDVVKSNIIKITVTP
jgi:hypothetical protein